MSGYPMRAASFASCSSPSTTPSLPGIVGRPAVFTSLRARREVKTAGLPTILGREGVVDGEEQLAKEAGSVGYAIILKASAGGGGRGVGVVRNQEGHASAY